MNRKEMQRKIEDLEAKMKEKDERVQFAEAMEKFAKVVQKRTVNNLQKNSSATRAASFSTYTKENIIQWLQNPSANEKNLRNASIYLYLSSMHYQRLINYYSGLYTWSYVISPLGFDKTKLAGKKAENFKKQYLKVAHDLEIMNLPETCRTLMNVALREGAYYGVRISDGTGSFIQRISGDICKISSMVDGVFLYSVDMSQIGKDKLEFYPKVVQDLYAEYEKDKIKWKEIPMDVSVCIKADPSIIEYSIPPFGAVMPSLYTIANAISLQETKDELNNYKMIAGEVPIDNNGKPLIGWDMYLKYYTQLENAVGDGVGLAISPFTLKSFDFEQSGSTAEIDNVSRAIDNYWTTAGTSGLLHGVSNNTSGVTKLAIQNDENYVLGIVQQIERMLNLYLKTHFSGTNKFKITLLPITIYNRNEFIEMYKGAVAFGLAKSHYAAALGITQADVEGLSYLENDVIQIDELLKPMVNSHNASSDELSRQGRPESSDDELSDSGEQTRDNDSNSNR